MRCSESLDQCVPPPGFRVVSLTRAVISQVAEPELLAKGLQPGRPKSSTKTAKHFGHNGTTQRVCRVSKLGQCSENRRWLGRLLPSTEVDAGVAIAKRDNLRIAARFLRKNQDPGSAFATDLHPTGTAVEAGQPFLYLPVHLWRQGASLSEPRRLLLVRGCVADAAPECFCAAQNRGIVTGWQQDKCHVEVLLYRGSA